MAKNNHRLTGIDLFRYLAIYAVIILHSDEGVSVHPTGWATILDFSGFAVPFFLGTFFYFAFKKIYATGEYYLKLRLTRLLIPYLFWTIIFTIYKTFKYLLQNEFDSLNKQFHDPIALIFFGGAAFHLYFLPLLVSGTIFIKPMSWLIKKQIKLRVLFSLCLLTLFLYEAVLISGSFFNTVHNETAIISQSLLNYPFIANTKYVCLLKLLLVELAFLIRCLPYIFISALIAHPKIQSFFQHKNIKYTIITLGLFLIFNIFGGYLFLESIYEVGRGYAALLLAIFLSNYLLQNQIIKSLSLCSFGIYLIQLLFIETFQIIETRIYPGGMFRVSTPSLLIFATLNLAASWIVTDILMKRKSLAKLMFGI